MDFRFLQVCSDSFSYRFVRNGKGNIAWLFFMKKTINNCHRYIENWRIFDSRIQDAHRSTVEPRYSDSFRQQAKSHCIEESHYFEVY